MDIAALFNNISDITERLKRLEARPIPATREEVQRLQNSGIRLDSTQVAKLLKEDILKQIPDTTSIKEQVDVAVQRIQAVSEQVHKKEKDYLNYLLILSGVLVFFVLLLGALVWHYSSYKSEAYKYSYLQKKVLLGGYERVSLASSIVYMDSVQGSQFSVIEDFVDTTDVAKVLALEVLRKSQAGKKKVLISENTALNVPPMFQLIFVLIGILLFFMGYRFR